MNTEPAPTKKFNKGADPLGNIETEKTELIDEREIVLSDEIEDKRPMGLARKDPIELQQIKKGLNEDKKIIDAVLNGEGKNLIKKQEGTTPTKYLRFLKKVQYEDKGLGEVEWLEIGDVMPAPNVEKITRIPPQRFVDEGKAVWCNRKGEPLEKNSMEITKEEAKKEDVEKPKIETVKKKSESSKEAGGQEDMANHVWCYWNEGFSIIPIKEKDKRPNIKSWQQYQGVQASQEEIQQWLNDGLFENIAIICGYVSNNLVVIDIDDEKIVDEIGLKFSKILNSGSWIVKTGKGWHIYYKHNENPGNIIKHDDLHLEFRANGGYVVAPPSIHPNGHEYHFFNHEKPEQLMSLNVTDVKKIFNDMVEQLQEKRGIKTKKRKIPDLKKGVKKGERNVSAFKLACNYRDGGLTVEEATKLMFDWNKKNRPPLHEKEIIACIKSAYSREKQESQEYITVEGDFEGTELNQEFEEKESQEYDDTSFVGVFERYINKRTNAPRQYATHFALQLLGHAVGVRCVHNIQPKPIHHNTYLSLIGPSTLARKTTLQELAMALALQDHMLPGDFSPEGLLKDMVETPQGIIPMGEFSFYLRHIKGNGYMAKIKEIFNELHGCPKIYQRRLSKTKDSVIIDDPYLNINTTCTPEEFFSNLDDSMLYGGFLARFILVDGNARYRLRGRLSGEIQNEESLIRATIRKVHDLFNQKDGGLKGSLFSRVEFEFDDEALEEFNKIDRKLLKDSKWRDIQPFIGRYVNYIIVYADLLFLSNLIGCIGLEEFNNLSNLNNLNNNNNLNNLTKINDFTPDGSPVAVKRDKLVKLLKLLSCFSVTDKKYVFRVPKLFVFRAFEIMRPCLEFAKQVTKFVNEDSKIARLHGVLKKHAPLIRSNAMRYTKMCKKDFDEALDTLTERDEVLEIKVKHDSKQFRDLRVYCLTSNKNSKKCNKCQLKNHPVCVEASN